MTIELIKVENINISFQDDEAGTISAVRDLSFHINEGETVGLVGESGCGKSVTALSLMGLIEKGTSTTEGEIVFEGEDINLYAEKKMRSIRGNKISMIFQEPMTSLNPVHKIGKQISEVLHLHGFANKTNSKEKTIDILKKVGIPRAESIIDEYPHQLSGGMRQRIMIAIAMACNPKLLIADEPTTALDVTIQAQILDLMNALQQEYNTSILLITHDLGVISEMADRVIVMYYGQIVEQADVRTLFKQPKHPYTIGLLNSVPNIDSESEERLTPIDGNVPSLGVIKSGCPFRSRCQHVHEKCHKKNPPLFKCDSQFVRCWLYEEQGVSV
ncbi:ABC transporter ATP-binding protein [Psychrobacillus lasiicapitis]|uniref:ABC transporter ATP-binding protein n=1 Tax=Psychrobacillus lasiicapitis TaxID=1636719 RepID=A0A544TBQ9_9BACI|nr:ABC transporter ATP-binding protein [Psychrobacillus lasiicapitis]TQR14893.1 ABC transporter ATP-binding protein [Psychrobacillus lasiicapitis]GGA20852.1 peptide ABC transporter ATP-binding protein [Psychrobacillus lasiicapitis]